jgi:hypothetical protein
MKYYLYISDTKVDMLLPPDLGRPKEKSGGRIRHQFKSVLSKTEGRTGSKRK